MAFDRIATFHIEEEGTNNEFGEYVPGPITDHRIWADIEDFGESEVAVAGAFRIVRAARFRIRWRADWAGAARLAAGPDNRSQRRHLRVTSISDFLQARRRLLTFQAIGTAP